MINDKGYYDFGDFLKKYFPFKVQKIAVNAGFTCPNRDGSKGIGGCTYCNNQTFNPEYCSNELSIKEQIDKGKHFFARKYPEMKYLAYFQAYTNTYGDIERLKNLYDEALAQEDVVGLIIGTRPDCMPEPLLDYFQELNKHHFVLIEYGAETSNDDTLRLINRGHLWRDTVDVVERTSLRGILCGLHLILGLPNEGINDIFSTIDSVAQLPINTLKLHQLQIIKSTRLAHQIAVGEVMVNNWTVEEYIDICVSIIKRIPQNIALERFVSQSPDSLLISPRWGLKNYEFTNLLNNKIKMTSTVQGSECQVF